MSLATLARRLTGTSNLTPAALPVATRPPMSKDDRRAIAVATLRQMSRRMFKTLPAIECMTGDELRAHTTNGNVLEPVVAALNAAGVQTAPTIGAVMDTLALDREQLHHGLCHCIYGETMTGHRAAENFAAFA